MTDEQRPAEEAPADERTADEAGVNVPAADHPVASVVIVAYGRDDLFQETVAALIAHTPPVYELIVVDNSPAGSEVTVPHGARLIRNEINVGFGAAVDQAALVCRGRMLVLLNPDAVVPEGWIEELASAMVTRPDLLGVAPMLTDPDGEVQELGSVVGPDAETLALGRGPAAALADDRVARPVDYASAACLVIRLRLFLALGGFDAAFGAGYFEDVDLIYRGAAESWPVELVPTVAVAHHRHGTTSDDEAARLMEERRGAFRSRWTGELDGRPSLTDVVSRPHRLYSAREVRRPDRLLVLDGGTSAISDLASSLAERRPDLAVTLVAEGPMPPGTSARVEVVLAADIDEAWLAARRLVHPYLLTAEATDGRLRERVRGVIQPLVDLRVEDSIVIDDLRHVYVVIDDAEHEIDRLLGLRPDGAGARGVTSDL